VTSPDPTAVERIAATGVNPKPGHPATADPALPSAGEQLSRGADEPAVPGDDVVLEEQDSEA
jgi:hypothetical protein